MNVFKFLWYCIKCLGGVIITASGFVPDDFTWKEGAVGIITLVVIMMIGILILSATGVIKFKKKSGKNKENRK